MNRIQRHSAILICLLFPSTWLSAGDLDPQLRRTIQAGWAELESLDDARNAIDAACTRHERDGSKESDKTLICRYRRKGQRARISADSGKVEDVVVNSKYLFMAARPSTERPWELRLVELDLSSPKAEQLLNMTFHPKDVAPTSFVFLGSFQRQQRKASSLTNDPKFKLSTAERLPDGLVKIRYQYDAIVGELDCDPAAHYLIMRGRATEKGPSLQYDLKHERHLVQSGVAGEAVVDRLDYEVVSTRGLEVKDSTTYSYPDVSESGELDEERFRLSAYDLPEPEGVVWDKPRRWLPYWLAGAGLAIVVATTLMLRRARRTRHVEAKP